MPQPLTHLASMTATFQSGVAWLERVLELLDADEQSIEQSDTVDPAPVAAASCSTMCTSRTARTSH